MTKHVSWPGHCLVKAGPCLQHVPFSSGCFSGAVVTLQNAVSCGWIQLPLKSGQQLVSSKQQQLQCWPHAALCNSRSACSSCNRFAATAHLLADQAPAAAALPGVSGCCSALPHCTRSAARATGAAAPLQGLAGAPPAWPAGPQLWLAAGLSASRLCAGRPAACPLWACSTARCHLLLSGTCKAIELSPLNLWHCGKMSAAVSKNFCRQLTVATTGLGLIGEQQGRSCHTQVTLERVNRNLSS